jgi:CRISPR-associated endonuclease/helicase Cas3
VIVARTDTLTDDPVYGTALGATWKWLEGTKTETEELDLGLRGIDIPTDAGARGLLAPRPQAPVLLPSHLDAFVQTSPAPTPDPDVALWLHGPERGLADVQVVWRADLSPALLERTRDESADLAQAAREAALGLVQAMPPASGEAMQVPLPAVVRWLDGRIEPDVFDVEGVSDDAARDDEADPRVSTPRLAVAWRGDASEIVDSRSLRPGDTLVVPASYGGVLSGTWTPAATDPVVDVAELAVLAQRGRATLRLHQDVVRGLLGPSVAPPTPAPADAEDVDDRTVVLDWIAGLSVEGLAPELLRWLEVLRGEACERRLRVERLALGPACAEFFLVSSRRRIPGEDDDVSTEDDRASFTGVEVPLEAHLGGVAAVAGELADRVGLPRDVAADIRLAGRWHDVGKVDQRFQRLLHGGSEYQVLVQPEPLAKSAMPTGDWRTRRRAQERSGYPAGARHEVTSVALMTSASELVSRAHDWDLVLHLVASHHGRCRPFAPWIPDAEPIEVAWTLDGTAVRCSSAHELERLDSGVGERFWRLVRRYGWWGLAWMETILRLGDHRRSEEEQHPGGSAS